MPRAALEAVWNDAGLSVRMLRRQPAFAAVALLTLALGIGASTAVFSVVHAVLIRPLPYPAADRIVRFRIEASNPGGSVVFDALPVTTALTWGARSRTLSAMALYNDRALTLSTPDGPFRLTGISATPNLFDLLGVAPMLGETFREATTGRRDIVLSHTAWTRFFAADRSAIGSTVTFDHEPYRIVAVMPAAFGFPTPEAKQYDVALAQARQNFAGVDVARTNVANAQAQLAIARKSLSYAVIPAPIDGFVTERTADLGEYVSPQQKVVTIVRTNPLRMRIDIPEQAIPEVRVGQSVSITTSAWPDRNFSGRVARIAPNVSATSRTLTVEAEIENGSGALKPGQFATVRILQERAEPAVLVPSRAVLTEAGVSRLYVIKNGHAEQRIVQTGQTDGDLIEIKSGLAADEQVATSNLEQLSDGIAIKQ